MTVMPSLKGYFADLMARTKQVYHVEMKDCSQTWEVHRRYTEFCRLHSTLKKQVRWNVNSPFVRLISFNDC